MAATDWRMLQQGLAPLDGYEAGLAASVLAFVTEGRAPELLLRIRNDTAIEGSRIGCLGQLPQMQYISTPGKWEPTPESKAVWEAAKTAQAARVGFYQALQTDAIAPEQLERLGQALAAIDKGQSLKTGGAEAPEWFHYLVYDVLTADVSAPYSRKPAMRPGWRLASLAAALASETAPALTMLMVIFESKALRWGGHPPLALLDWADADAWIIAHAATVHEAAVLLSTKGRIALATALGDRAALTPVFIDLLVKLAINDAKGVRDAALPRLTRIDQAARVAELGRHLRTGKAAEKLLAADLLAREDTPESRLLLTEAQAAAKNPALLQALDAALGRLAISAASTILAPPPLSEVPADPPWPEQVYPLLVRNWQALRIMAEENALAEIERNKDPDHTYKWNHAQSHWERFGALTEANIKTLFETLRATDDKAGLDHYQRQIVFYENKLPSLPELQVGHLLRLAILQYHHNWWSLPALQKWLQAQPAGSVDLRDLATRLSRVGGSAAMAGQFALRGPALAMLPEAQIWPFFAEHLDYLEIAFGMAPGVADIGAGLSVLATFPSIPPRLVAPLLELALGEHKSHRADAQAVAAKLPDLLGQITAQLQSGKQTQKIVAADWLARLAASDRAPDLRAALDKEKNEAVRAALLTALERLGTDIAAFLSPDVLLAEAKKGLAGKLPASLAWFPFGALPKLRWAANKKAIAAEIPIWWVVLAGKLQAPGGNALLQRYLGLLDAADRAELGKFILQSFIRQDTLNPSADDCAAFAEAHAQKRLAMYQGLKNNPEYCNRTYEQVFEELRREKQSTYLGSAIAAKGVLALAAYAPGHDIVALLRAYMRDHFQRSAQIEAMLEAGAAGADPLVIQLLLSLARRYRTASVQARAKELVKQIAERNGWNDDQLADRTVPTAGFDESGTQTIEYGERKFTVILDAALKPVLRNAEGKPVKALPEPRKGDPAEVIKEAKAQWSAARKELPQIIALQTGRLFEAMCAGRAWPAAEWQEFLRPHPIVGRLIQRLVWLRQDADGKPRGPFRPTEDGSLIDAGDDEVTLQADDHLRIAHGSLLTAEEEAAWLGHFKDYKVAPLFPQIARPRPEPALLADDKKAIENRKGWLTDAFTLRGVLTKLGYQREQAIDGGYFTGYCKDFPALGLRATIGFTGNSLPEQNVAAALTELSFEKLGGNRWNPTAVPLRGVPSVLLGEAYADYLAVAAACAGFDPEWGKKAAW